MEKISIMFEIYNINVLRDMHKKKKLTLYIFFVALGNDKQGMTMKITH
jgi:hypothetical protein